ncbi:flavodoxin [Alkalihalobacterium elongatum]|uniref:flavodoxin n=1 Tax=Alkalihalobacterium elongatum TaxID=2675466 RepID=UPI001C2001DF|nr:flavodoxin [Alkalihalobacterium elongatum]
MSEVLLVYASMSGNTEAIADLIEEGLQEESMNVTKLEVMDCDAEQLNAFDAIILGAYTWGDGELPDEFLDLYDEMAGLDLTNKQFAVFGSGDTAYEIFCGAVDLLEAMIEERNGQIVQPGLKIELGPDGEEETCKGFGREFAKKVKLETSV